MAGFIKLLKRFQADQRGAFGVLFGLMAVVLVATAGAVEDYTAVEQARTRGQVALDAAALALQPSIYTLDNATLKTKAQALLVERINDSRVTAVVNTVTVNTTDGQLKLDASITVPTAFVTLIGINNISARLISEATRKRLNIEVALVLDNSGSMASNNRMTNLKSAANNAVDILFSGAATQPNVYIGVVPFTELVNVGTSNANASWMDTTGVSPVSRENFDDDDDDATPFNGPLNRFSIYSAMSNTSWQGCVEARTPPYDTNDAVPTIATPSTLFVPVFAPDEPSASTVGDTYYNNYFSDTPASCTRTEPRYVWTQVKTKCNTDVQSYSSSQEANAYNNMICSGGTTTNTYQKVSELGVTTAATSTRPASIYDNPDPGASVYSDTYTTTAPGSGTYKYTNTRVRTWTYKYSDREMQERICKYTGQTPSTSVDGPNSDCLSTALLPLTNVAATVKSKITSMVASGGTNIHQGVMWGFHMLSPTEPLTEGKAYDAATYKVMIVMTDGENTAYTANNFDGLYLYMPYGFPFQGRWTGPSASQLQVEMDNKTTATCANAKAAGITIYAIGLATNLTSNPTTTAAMLTACATDAAHAYFPASPSDLTTVFEDIAGQLADLRIAQ